MRIFVVLVVICTTGWAYTTAPESSKEESVEQPKPAPAQPSSEAAAPEAPPTPITKPTYSMAEKCSSPCLFLMDHSYKEVQARLCEWCEEHVPERCEYDWPSGFPDCEWFDHLRNCIYASHGYSFTKKEWQQHFEGMSWYKPNPNFAFEQLSDVAQKNVEECKRLRKNKFDPTKEHAKPEGCL